ASGGRRLRRRRHAARAVRSGAEGLRAARRPRIARSCPRRGAARVPVRAVVADEAASSDRVRRRAAARPERQASQAPAARPGRGAHVMSAATDRIAALLRGRVPQRAQAGLAAFSTTRAYRGYVLGLLVVVGVVGWVDRNVFAVLLESIKLDLGLSDDVLGLLVGSAFIWFYSPVRVHVALLYDCYRPHLLLAAQR